MIKLLVLIVFLTSNVVFSSELVVVENNTSKKILVVKKNAASLLNVSDQLKTFVSSGKECFFSITSVQGDFLTASTEDCESSDEIEAGTELDEAFSNKLKVAEPKSTEHKIATSLKKIFELDVFSVQGQETLIQSNEKNNNTLLFKIKERNVKIKTVPLNLRLEVEGETWGILSDINISTELADVGFYKRSYKTKFGAGLTVSHDYAKENFDVNGKNISTDELTITAISPYFFIKHELCYTEDVCNLTLKSGGVFFKAEDGTTSVDYNAFFIRPKLDYFFRLSPNVLLGLGAGINMAWLEASVESSGISKDGYGTIFTYQIDFLKLRFEF